MTTNPKNSEIQLEKISCNLCGADDTRVLYNRPYRPDSFSESASCAASTDEFNYYGQIVRCRQCGLAYTNPRPTAQEMLKGYGDCTDTMYLAQSSSRSINAHLSLNTIKHFIHSGKLLEVGAAVGYFLNAARVDFDVAGIEPSQWACNIARDKFKLDCYCEAFETTNRFAPGSLDVVVMIDVIEHFSDPKACVRRAAELLKSGGIFYLVTPNISSLSSKILRSNWYGLRAAHLYYFDDATMARLLKEFGFEIVFSKSFGRIFSYGYWCSRLRNYPRWIYQPLRAVIRWMGMEEKFLYLNTRDSMEICAKKL